MTRTVAQIHADYDIAFNYAKLIALLPVDIWVEELEHAESIVPILDPTLYRDYIYSKKPEIIKKVLHSLLEVKRTVEEVQKELAANPEAYHGAPQKNTQSKS